MKKAFILSAMLVASTLSPLTCSAADFTSDNTNDFFGDLVSNVEVYSPEYPNAYFNVEPIPFDEVSSIHEDGTIVGAATVTVYYEEVYEVHGASLVCTSSRLLSEEEVKQNEASDARNNISDNAYEERGELQIVLFVTGYNYGSSGVRYQLDGSGRWFKENSIFNDSATPSAGNDFFGYTWGGGFDCENDFAINIHTHYGYERSYNKADISPNAGIMWEFYEGPMNTGDGEYVDEFYVTGDIFKNTLTGEGNTTAVAMKYIHTYSNSNYGISIGGSSIGDWFPSVSISPSSSSWQITAYVSGLEY